jgi:hypothetical protein
MGAAGAYVFLRAPATAATLYGDAPAEYSLKDGDFTPDEFKDFASSMKSLERRIGSLGRYGLNFEGMPYDGKAGHLGETLPRPPYTSRLVPKRVQETVVPLELKDIIFKTTAVHETVHAVSLQALGGFGRELLAVPYKPSGDLPTEGLVSPASIKFIEALNVMRALQNRTRGQACDPLPAWFEQLDKLVTYNEPFEALANAGAADVLGLHYEDSYEPYDVLQSAIELIFKEIKRENNNLTQARR